MINHPYITSQVAEARRQQLQEAADHHRLVRAARLAQPRIERRSRRGFRVVRRVWPTPRVA
jgi:hypothetical protein